MSSGQYNTDLVPVSDVPVSDVLVPDVPVPDVPVSDVLVSDVPVSDVLVPDVPVSDVLVPCTEPLEPRPKRRVLHHVYPLNIIEDYYTERENTKRQCVLDVSASVRRNTIRLQYPNEKQIRQLVVADRKERRAKLKQERNLMNPRYYSSGI